MVGHLSKALRWFFGIQALLFAAISIRFARSLPQLLWLEKHTGPVARIMGFWSPSGWLALGLALTLSLTFIFAIACWRLGTGTSSARNWAIAASIVSIPMYLVGPPARISAAAGILGLIIFSRRSTADQAAIGHSKHPRIPGDGTSPITEWIAAFAMFGSVLFAGSLWSNWAQRVGLPPGEGAFMRLVLIQLAALITTVIHESGHALAAAFLDMKVRHLILGPFEWKQKAGRWRLRTRAMGVFTIPGAVGAVPANLDNLRWRYIIFAAAGPLASLWLGLAAAWATVAAKGSPWEDSWKLLSYIATFSLIAFILNLVPIAQKGQYSDGARIFQLLRRNGWSDVYHAFAIVGSTLVTPLRPRDWNNSVIEKAASFLGNSQKAFVLQLNCWSHCFESGKTAEADHALDRAEAVDLAGYVNLTVDLIMEMAFANAMAGRYAAARVWWKRAEGNLGPAAEIEFSVDYWKARCALLLSEGHADEAEAAWDRADVIAATLPIAGAYDFDRFCLARLRQFLDDAASPLEPESKAVAACSPRTSFPA